MNKNKNNKVGPVLQQTYELACTMLAAIIYYTITYFDERVVIPSSSSALQAGTGNHVSPQPMFSNSMYKLMC